MRSGGRPLNGWKMGSRVSGFRGLGLHSFRFRALVQLEYFHSFRFRALVQLESFHRYCSIWVEGLRLCTFEGSKDQRSSGLPPLKVKHSLEPLRLRLTLGVQVFII